MVVMKALTPAPPRTHEHTIEAQGTWWECHLFTTIVRVGGELRRVTGQAREATTAYANCIAAAQRHEGQS